MQYTRQTVLASLVALAALVLPSGAMAMDMANPLPTTLAGWSQGAQLFDGLGPFHRRITTRSPLAQRYFDQGMRLLWAFNHDESTRSFARALELDSRCAMCAWGVALTIGPNYNFAELAAPRARVAFAASTRAQALARAGTPVERALVAALALRYPGDQPLDAQAVMPVLTAYADSMRAVARRFPADLDVQVLYAESLMNLHAWKLWGADGKPAEGTPEIEQILEHVLARQPMHMGALHYYVHAMEASPHPEKALVAAEHLRGYAPAAGHLEHMPAHILQRVGLYEQAAEANRKGAAADLAYMARTTPPDYYPMYLGHNYQFLAYSAAMEGRQAESTDALRRSRAGMSDALLKAMPGTDWYVAQSYATEVWFGEWDALLAEAAPDAQLPGLTGGYLYGTAMALAGKGRVAEARERLAQLDALRATVPADTPAGLNVLRDVLAVASSIVEARIATAEARDADAVHALEEAVRLEDALAYDEPADWFMPSRHLLGAQLLRMGGAADAEHAYREQLLRQPHDGWALRGLANALQSEGRVAESLAVAAQFREAWSHATVAIESSAFWPAADASRTDATPPVAAVAAAALAAGLAHPPAGQAVLDVRTPEEFAAGHVPGARNIPVQQLESRLGELDGARSGPLVVYCRTGHRAGIALQVLAAHGFTRLAHLEGDMQGWLADGLPVEPAANPQR
jgi:rhodanese-related sulfurtransferase/tetratricopeptide (TPR) repeat protein